MAKPTLDELKATYEQQNQALEAFAAALKGDERIEIPVSFFEAFDEACEVRRAPSPNAFNVMFNLNLRA